MHDSLKDFKSVLEISLAWGEMDAAQHINNAVYLRYGETGRIAYLQKLGLDFDLKGKGVVLAEVNCKYKFPLTFPDKIWIGTRALLDTLDEFGFWTEQVIVSHRYQRISTVIRSKLVYYDFVNLKKTPLTQNNHDKVIRFEKT